MVWQNVKLMKFQVDKMSSWRNVKLTKCQVDEMSSLSYLIFWVLKRLAPFGAKIILILINPRRLAPNYLEPFIGNAPPLFILDPLIWIGSAYYFVYINSCHWLNKLLTNLTSLRQHHLQYKLMKCQVDEMSSWWNVKLTKCQVDEM
jgi:hypothetical protein